MATEILAVPEDHLREVIAVLRAGLDVTAGDPTVSPDTREALTAWCDDEAAYLDGFDEDRHADDG